MKITRLQKIKKLYFDYEELAKVFEIGESSARVSAGRYCRNGLLVRVKRNVYMLQEIWKNAGREDKFLIANIGQTPSYISLMTALDYYNLTTQMQRHFFESVAVKRTKQMNINGTRFQYTKILNDLYFGFRREKGFFIATPEKALLDAFYLLSYGRYAFDLSSINSDKLDREQIKVLSKQFPLKTRKLMERNGYL